LSQIRLIGPIKCDRKCTTGFTNMLSLMTLITSGLVEWWVLEHYWNVFQVTEKRVSVDNDFKALSFLGRKQAGHC
jgi:hypothetical protein